ncbi:3-oxoacyl-[acyl-carrier protein] reductase [Novosphingobium hassiacum]|uniref:3-oxoacyl-[acyl-carrier protein] reductase n=1 Tax=Novosphingobium hassiacum TaxID=173676 RepID=A0A7W5ZZ23_9SPHN|nr:SDR family oxidoreductase [Novosphingobium hassiacum]MBB3860917.1 3-oxoacyl-[acyl-carrier protein] reductase [Novosphingobium hassiacum]
MGKLDGRVAIVTGGGRGIGRAIAELFASEGAKVVIGALSDGPSQEVVDGIVANGGHATRIRTDVGNREDCRNLVKHAVDTFGTVDIVVHNAAHVSHGAIDQLSEDELDATFKSGVYACFWLTRDALPYLEKSKGGRVLLTSSTAGLSQAYAGLSHYSAVKSAINGFVRGAGLELARRGITVNAVAPGMTLGHHIMTHSTPEQRASMAAGIPVGRAAEPIEQAHGFLYLASDEARYVTGHVLTIDGGSLLGKAGTLFD